MSRTKRLKETMMRNRWTCQDVVDNYFKLTGDTVTPGCVRNWRNEGRKHSPTIPMGKLLLLEAINP